uniref:Uncharacterized protein n=1 Tax=Romanomermis culicivorax TaxID=13658 RepID=A0A915K6K1_ROMCU
MSQKNIKRNENICTHLDLTFTEREQGQLLCKRLKENQDFGENFWAIDYTRGVLFKERLKHESSNNLIQLIEKIDPTFINTSSNLL